MNFSLIPASAIDNPQARLAVNILLFVIFVIEMRILPRQSPGAKIRERYSYHAVLAVLFTAILLAVGVAHTGVGRLSLTWLPYPGLVVLLGGFLLRQTAILSLGRYFTPRVAVRQGQHLLTSGLYAYVRHPSYTGLLLEAAGFGLLLANGLALLILLGLAIPSLLYRIRMEEKVLRSFFGEEYAEYSGRTRRLVPFLY